MMTLVSVVPATVMMTFSEECQRKEDFKMSYFVNYSNYKIQLLNPYTTFGFIGLIFGLLIIFTCRKNENNFFDIKTTQSLRGIAILFLIFGHLSYFTLSEKMFFNLGGTWAVSIFLFISGYGLHQKYQFKITEEPFWKKRIKKLFVPFWISTVLFILLNYFLINLSYSPLVLILNFIGVLFHVNSTAWFVEYILVLYLVYWVISKLPVDELVKIFLLFASCLLIAGIIYLTPLKNYYQIWIWYTLVFPLGVTFSKYKKTFLHYMGVFNRTAIVIPLFFFVFLTIYYFWWHIIYFLLPIVPITLFGVLKPIPLLFAIVLFLFLYEKINYQSTFLVFLGNYSYEIYLLHYPFMYQYDFFLFREPLYFFFFLYFSLLIVISITLAKLSSSVLKRSWHTGGKIY